MMGIYTLIHLPSCAYEGKLLFSTPTCEKYIMINLPEGKESKLTPKAFIIQADLQWYLSCKV